MTSTAPARWRRVAAYGLCRDGAGNVLLVPASGDTWALPGGTVPHGESPQSALGRLVRELTGLSLPVGGLREAMSDQVSTPDGTVVHHDRLVFDLVETGSGPPAGGARWFDAVGLSAIRLLPYTAAVTRQGIPGMIGASMPGHTERDMGFPIDPIDGTLALDRAGPRPRIQRFSTYAVATDPRGRILLARIAPGFPGADRWHLPGGGTDFGESPAAGLVREMLEETGQSGRVVGPLGVSHRHNPAALGWEGYPIDWHTIRVVYRVIVDEPTRPHVMEGAGGSTAESAWFEPADVDEASLSELAAAVLADSALALGTSLAE